MPPIPTELQPEIRSYSEKVSQRIIELMNQIGESLKRGTEPSEDLVNELKKLLSNKPEDQE